VIVGALPEFAGRTVLVTGAASGIGRALAAQLVEVGADVTVADIDIDALASTEVFFGGSVRCVELDVRRRDLFADRVAAVVDRCGRLDVLINNAGVSVGGPTHELTGAHWDACLDANLSGVVNGVLAAYPEMVRRGAGRIVNIASGAGLVAPPLVVPYATSKHAVVALSRALRPEALRHGVQIQVVCPAAVETPILDREPADLPLTASAPVTAREYLGLLRQRPMPADRFAQAAISAIGRNRAIIVVPRRAAALWYLDRLSPALTERFNRRLAGLVTNRLVHPAGEQ
jgi:NAD(P)-dependent dehydrogenase (short-subunit alcohol dehydrogenase family)